MLKNLPFTAKKGTPKIDVTFEAKDDGSFYVKAYMQNEKSGRKKVKGELVLSNFFF